MTLTLIAKHKPRHTSIVCMGVEHVVCTAATRLIPSLCCVGDAQDGQLDRSADSDRGVSISCGALPLRNVCHMWHVCASITSRVSCPGNAHILLTTSICFTDGNGCHKMPQCQLVQSLYPVCTKSSQYLSGALCTASVVSKVQSRVWRLNEVLGTKVY